MQSIETHLNSLDFSTQLSAVKKIMETAEVKTTFWGSRVVVVKGFSGSVYLDDIAHKIICAGNKRSDADNLLPAERIAGINIVRKLKNLYSISDVQIKNSNFFTKFLNWIREYSIHPYTTRFYLEVSAEQRFRAYSEAKFLHQFGGAFDSFHHHPASNGSFGPPLRIVAKKKMIDSLLPNH